MATDLEKSKSQICLAWRHLSVSTPKSLWSTSKPILRHVSGFVAYHSLTAFLGPSGAGKTTLLNYLSGNHQKGLKLSSEFYLNPKDVHEVAKLQIGFIAQQVHEALVPSMSVGEALRYAFRFKNHGNFDQMETHIEATLSHLLLPLDLLKRPFGQCSGGEQKRVTIAQELMSMENPPGLLLLDEPTTGLDSTAALLLVECLRKLCLTHRIAIALSIHLPSDDLLARFDQLYILARGGLSIYAGPPKELRQRLLVQLGCEISEDKPPVEEWLRIGCGDISNAKVCELSQKTHSQVTTQLKCHLPHLCHQPNGIRPHRKCFSPSDLLLQLLRLVRIIFVLEWHGQAIQLSGLFGFFVILTALFDPKMVLHTACSPVPTNSRLNYTAGDCLASLRSDAYVQSYISYQLYVVMFLQVITLNIAAIFISKGFQIYMHEFRNAWYSFTVLTTSFITIRLVESIIFTILAVLLSYFFVDHRLSDGGHLHWSRLGHFVFFHLIYTLIHQSVGHLCGVIFLERFELAFGLSTLLSGILSSTNGLLANVTQMDRPLMTWMANAVGTIHLVKGLFWSFYGLDRCNDEREKSLVLLEYSIEPKRIYQDLWHVILNIFLVRLTTVAILYFRLAYRKIIHLNPPKDLKAIQLDSPTVLQCNQVLSVEQLSGNSDNQQTQFCQGKLIVAWRHLTLFKPNSFLERQSVSRESSNKTAILRDIAGSLQFGELTALMGCSGAGKTSLLQVLNGRFKAQLSQETEIYLSRFVPITTCFVAQEVSNHLWTGLTVQQSLLYASRLKNSGVEKVDHLKTTNRLLEELQLMDVSDNPVQKCSGGERKRLALAQELTAKHLSNLVCFDEPTSGLDSNSAELVVACLHRLVRNHPIAIMVSVHQPNHTLLGHFDQVYALARGGVCIYHGKPEKIAKHLSNLSNPLLEGYPLEELIRLSSFDHQTTIIDQMKSKTWQVDSTWLKAETRPVETGFPSNRVRFSLLSVWLLTSRFACHFRQYFWFLWCLQLLIYVGAGGTFLCFFNSRIALATGCVDLEKDAFHLDPNENDTNQCGTNLSPERLAEQSDLMNNFRYTYFTSFTFIFMTSIQVGLNFFQGWSRWRWEQRNGWYSLGALYLTSSLTELALLVPIILAYVLMVNIYGSILSGYYWTYSALLLLAILSVQPMAQTVALISKGRLHLLLVLLSFVCLMSMLLGSSMLAPFGYRVAIFEWLSYFSITRQITDACIVLQYGFGRCRDGVEVPSLLYQLGIEHHSHFYHQRLLALIVNLIFWRLVALLLLMSRSRKDQRSLLTENFPLSPDKFGLLIVPGLAAQTEFRIKQIKI